MFRIIPHCLQIKRHGEMTEGGISPSPNKIDLKITKNYRGITFTAITAKVYHLLHHNPTQNRENSLEKSARRNRSRTLQILTISWIVEGVRAKNIVATLLVVDSSKAFDSMHRRRSKYYLNLVISKKQLSLHQPKQNHYCIADSKQREALVSTWM